MPVLYNCDQCKVTSESLTGWFVSTIMHCSIVGMPEPTSRGQLGPQIDLYFHEAKCQDDWCKKADVPAPPRTEPPA